MCVRLCWIANRLTVWERNSRTILPEMADTSRMGQREPQHPTLAIPVPCQKGTPNTDCSALLMYLVVTLGILPMPWGA